MMNKLKGKLGAKLAAVILLASCFLLFCGAAMGVFFLDGWGAYQGKSVDSVRQALVDDRLENAGHELMDRMLNQPVSLAYDSAVRFELLDENERVLAGNLGEGETVLQTQVLSVRSFYGDVLFTAEDEALTMPNSPIRNGGFWSEEPDELMPTPMPTPMPVAAPAAPEDESEPADGAPVPEGTKVRALRLYWTEETERLEPDTELRLYEKLAPFRYTLIAAGAAAVVLGILLFVFLMAAAGHRDDTGEIRATFVEKIPFDLLLCVCAAGICLLILAVGESFSSSNLVASLIIAAVCLIGSGLLALLCLMTLAVRLKQGTFLDSCLLWRIVRGVFRGIRALLRGLPLVLKWIPLFAVVMIADCWLSTSFRRDTDVFIFVLLLRWALLAAAALYLVLCFRRLRNGAKAIAAGEEQVVIDTKYLIGDLKAQAEDLTHIRDGLSRAVDERMKSERLRTELITNVSHDIKTPLTSIVNYVDLLSREELQNEKAEEYIEVLQRQSARLKKLTDDLVEASKASTGNLPVAPEQLDLGVLLDQIGGEYGERLADKKLDLVVSKPDGPVPVQADPRHLWRVLDNLMSNVLKYAMPGTRVYIDLERGDGSAALRLRNISAEPLHVSPEELTERFVRGDSARSTEGSGLGLAIAASLCRLQDIVFDLAVDGDLFKVTLQFQH